MSRTLTIGQDTIGDGEDCYVIAEIGHNHQGDLDKCKKLFDAAKLCGANAVKLQKRDNKTLFTQEMFDSPYNSENAYGPTYGLHREALEFEKEEYLALIDYANKLNITFFSTAFDVPSADFLAELGMPAYKIASADLTNTPLLKHVAKLGKPMIMSTGGGTMEDVERAYDIVYPINQKICILQCTSMYPCSFESMNLRVIQTYRERFPDTVIGLSGHDNGIAMSLAAQMLGAQIIEKHFTLDRTWKGTDHPFSLEPPGLRRLVRDLRRAQQAMGDGVKKRLPAEDAPMLKMSKKIVAARPLAAGTPLTADDLEFKAPGNGLPPYVAEDIIGQVTRRPLEKDEAILHEDLTNK